MDRGIGCWPGRHAFRNPERLAYVEGDREVTWAGFEAATNRLARGLIALGVRRGDRVAVLLANSVEFVEVTFACAKVGAVLVPVNTRLAGPEVAYILGDSGADVLVSHDVLGTTAHAALRQPGPRVRVHVVVAAGWDHPPLPAVDQAGPVVAYDEVGAGAGSEPLGMDIDERDLQGIMYTSGTTGRPKGAMLTHANHWANARNNATFDRGLHGRDVTVTAAPLFHIGGLGVHTLPLAMAGGTNVLQPGFDPRALVAAIARYRATVQFLVPAMSAAVLRVPDLESYDLTSLELCLSGGAPTPLPVIEAFAARGVPFQEGFGMTETAPAVSVLDPDHVKAKLGSIGRPLPEVEARIVDEDDRTVAVGEVGELVLQGANITPGYWMLPAASAEAWRSGWFHTGDLGKVDDEGFITLVDRKKDMIITGGENVYPIEIEQVLFRHPAVREVAIFGVPDERWGETVVAAVAWDEGAEPVEATEIIAFCRERLAHFKCPTRVEVVEELPRNATGKVLKTELRSTFGPTASAVSR